MTTPNTSTDNPSVGKDAAPLLNNNDQTSSEMDDEINLWALLTVLVDHLRLLVVGTFAVGVLTMVYSFFITPIYTAQTTFLAPQSSGGSAALLQSLGGLAGLVGGASGIKNPVDQYVAFLKSRRIQDAVIKKLNLLELYQLKNNGGARGRLGASTQITSGKDGLIRIDVDDADPQRAAQIANAYVMQLTALLNEMGTTEAQQRRIFFERQLKDSKDKLTKADIALKNIGVSSAVLKSQPQAALAAVAQLQAQISAQEIKLKSMRGYLSETASDFRQAQTELAALRSQLSKLDQNSSSTQVGNDAAAKNEDYITRYRDYKYYETLFELFAKQYELARLDESRDGTMIQVLDAAEAPLNRSKPKRAQLILIAMFATAFGLILFIFIRHALRNAMMNKENTELTTLRQSFRRQMRLK